MKLNFNRLKDRKQSLPITLQYFAEDLRGFNRVAKRYGLSHTKLEQKAVEAGMPLVVASLEAKPNKVKE